MTRIKTSDFPKFDQRNYATIRAHFDSVKPWVSKYNPDGDEKPIGDRACKLTSDGENWGSYEKPSAEERARQREGARFNKAMRLLDDESVAFRLYDTDCVVYHPDDSLTIHSWPTVSTNDFINALTPMGISHTCRKEPGRGGSWHSSVLHLRPIVEHVSPPTAYRDEELRWTGPDWRNGMVVNCDDTEVTLHYSVETGHYVPTHPDELEPFTVFEIDRKAAREQSKRYGLAKLEAVVNAATALMPGAGYSSQRTEDGAPMCDIMDALLVGDLAAAVSMMPRGGGSTSFGRKQVPATALRPGFLRRLRDFIYDYEGVVRRIDKPILTPLQYQRYVSDTNRYDA